MDPQGTREIRNLIRELADAGATVFLSSHLLSEVEQVCTHVAVVSLGRLVAQGSLDELRGLGRLTLRVETDDTARAAGVLTQLGLREVTVDGTLVSATLGDCRPEDCCSALVIAGVRVRGLTAQRPSLEDAFVALTGEGFDVVR